MERKLLQLLQRKTRYMDMERKALTVPKMEKDTHGYGEVAAPVPSKENKIGEYGDEASALPSMEHRRHGYGKRKLLRFLQWNAKDTRIWRYVSLRDSLPTSTALYRWK